MEMTVMEMSVMGMTVTEMSVMEMTVTTVVIGVTEMIEVIEKEMTMMTHHVEAVALAGGILTMILFRRFPFQLTHLTSNLALTL